MQRAIKSGVTGVKSILTTAYIWRAKNERGKYRKTGIFRQW